MSVADDHRTRPRRRGEQLTAAIFDAVFAELKQAGYAQLTMDAVAVRSRTSKASLYRRWPSKIELVIDAVYSRLPQGDVVPDTGALRSDLIDAFVAVVAQFNGVVGIALRGVNAESLLDDEVAERVSAASRGVSRAAMEIIAARAVASGELDAELVTPRRLEAGPSLMRNLVLFRREPVTREVVLEVIDEVVLPLLRAPLAPHPR